ncbi:AbfB domain-containing protein [Actinoplanes sp. CA-030573]|uniref:AbfB domain-containing protein n=1 Tax=Actinoplanes sp. CA-030573 TaxID=3239898 RepID=UPI003D8DE8FF
MPHDDERFGRLPVPYRPMPPRSVAAEAAHARRVLVACSIAVTAGVAGVMALILPLGGDEPDPVAQQITYASPWDFEPSAPVSMLPAPSSSTSASPSATRPPAPPPGPPAAPVRARTPRPGTTPPGTAPTVDLDIGSTVGLELAGRPGRRLRHRDFIGRVDPIGPSSTDLERADSRFVVRKGLARGGCVSLESTNYPGYFLRHRDFVLRLDQRDRRRDSLFAEDATFCATPTRDGTAIVLESINYPSRSLRLRDDGVLVLEEGSGAAFAVRSPL